MFKDNCKYFFSLEKYLKEIDCKSILELPEAEKQWVLYSDDKEVEPISKSKGIIYLPDGVHHILIEYSWCKEEYPTGIRKLIVD